MQIYIKRTVVLFLYLLTVNIQCLPGMLSESQVIASKLQCQLSKSVSEILQIENINKNEYGIFRTKKEHLIKFDEFGEYTLDQDVLVYIDKKVRNQYIMKLKYEKNYDVEQYVIEGRNYVYIRTQLVNMQNKKEIINLHLLNIYQQGSIKQLIQETLNGLQFSFKFIDQQDYFVQIIFATLFENDFKGTNLQVANLVQEIQKNYMSCIINECKKDKEFSLQLQNIQLQQIPPIYIKECSYKTSQSIQYYQQINSIYSANIELEKDEIEFNIEFKLECIKLMSSNEERNHIRMEFDQYFCINNLIYHFRFISIQNYQRFNYYVILLQVRNDINQNKLIEELFVLIENLKCQKNIQITNNNLEKLIQMNSSFIQQQNNQNNKEIKAYDDNDSKVFVEENINIQIDDEYQQINKQSNLLYPNNNENSDGIQFIQINQSYGSTPQLLEIKQDLPLEEEQINLEQQQLEMEKIINDDIFDQPLQLEEQQHQQRLNQINQYEKKTQENEESINFKMSDNQQEQKIENIVFDEYNQQQQQKQDLEYPLHQSNSNRKSKEEVQKQEQNQIRNQGYGDHQNRYKMEDNYDQYYTHQRHHRHHSEQFRSTQYDDEQLDEEQESHHHHHHHHHHQFHHNNYQFDNEFSENENNNLRGFRVDSKRNNLRGKNNRDYQLSDNNDPEIIDRIIIEYNFSQRENDDTQEQQVNSQKKDHKKENAIAGPKKQQIQYDQDQTKLQKNEQNKKVQDNDSNENKNNKSNNKALSTTTKTEDGGEEQQENDDQTQQDKPKALSAQKQNNKDKDNQQQQKVAETNKKQKEKKVKDNEDEEINQSNDKTEDDQDKKIKQNKKQKDQNDQDNQEENQEENKEENQPEDEQEEANQTNKDEVEDAQEQDEVEKEEQNEDQKLDEEDQNDQENQQAKKKQKTKKQSNNNKDENKKQKQKQSKKQQVEDEENIENGNEGENEDELYDFNGRYIPNDPFYEHRKSKRGRYPFNYPTNDPYQDVFGNERFWRYETMKRQQVRYPFNGYPYRHRKQTVDHSPFPHVNSYYKMHPFQSQTYHCSPWVGRDFYPDTGYGMSRVTAAYKGRYTDPDQVLRDLTIKQQQQKQWKRSVQQYRDQVGYKYADYDLDFQPDYSQSYEDIVQQYPDYDHTILDPNQFQPYEEKSNKTHDFLNDPSFQFRQGKKPLEKTNQFKTFNPPQFDENDCFVVYDQCNFQGNRLDLCGEYPDIPQYINGFKIFSFIVPDNLQIRFFQSTDFENNIQNVEGTSDCLKVPYELVPNIQQ